MQEYYVSTRADARGSHEVHTTTCSQLPAALGRLFLGDHDSSAAAVRAASQYCRPCHACSTCGDQIS